MDLVLKRLALCLFALQADPAFCKKTNQPVLVDPFDLGAGGANLTLASGAGTLLANPALLPYGGTFHRWVGLDTWLLTNKEAVDTVLDAVQGGMNGGSSASENSEATDQESLEDSAEGEADGEDGGGNSEFIDKVFATPLHFGWGMALSYYTNNGGLAVLSRFEPDIRARKRGSTGVPEISLRGESYHGAVGALAARSPWRWLSFGLAAKYLYVSESELDIEVTDQAAIDQLQDPGFIRDLTEHGTGLGFDAGMLIFNQTKYFDWRLAAKVDDIGGTTFSGAGKPDLFEQVVSAGTSITFHTGSDAIHLAADYRDILGAYDEELFKKVYASAKVLIRTYVGVSAGVYHGYPSYGAELDLLLMRIAGTYYTREFGDNPGVDPRGIYIVSVAAGI